MMQWRYSFVLTRNFANIFSASLRNILRITVTIERCACVYACFCPYVCVCLSCLSHYKKKVFLPAIYVGKTVNFQAENENAFIKYRSPCFFFITHTQKGNIVDYYNWLRPSRFPKECHNGVRFGETRVHFFLLFKFVGNLDNLIITAVMYNTEPHLIHV